MPLLSITQTSDDCRLAVWNITEQPHSLVDAYPQLSHAFNNVSVRFKSLRRRQEYLAIRALLINLSDGCLPEVVYDSNGRPLLSDGRNVSFSHTNGYAVVMMADSSEVGVDIEQRSDRVARVAHLFLRDDEMTSSVEAMLVMWSAKEAVYKLFSDQHLTFQEMRVRRFSPSHEGTLVVENLKSGLMVEVHYVLNDEYVLTMCSMNVMADHGPYTSQAPVPRSKEDENE